MGVDARFRHYPPLVAPVQKGKTDKDGDTIVVVYVTHEGTDGKAQFFIKPEKLQLSHDFKDLDPAKVLSKIELTLKSRTIAQEYDDEI
jgi:hypothetical protein